MVGARPRGSEPVVVIMAGGAGTRFWPASTRRRPKQFLQLLGERSLLQQSYDRAVLLTSPQRVLVLTNADFVSLVREQLPDLPPGNAIGEPMRRDTAAAVTLGVLVARRRFGEAVMVVLTADHLIDPPEAFRQAVLSAVDAADTVVLYTFGIPPTYAATGYGYLHRGPRVLDDGGIEHFALLGFREKPDLETARGYVESGEFLWNSGMFVWSLDAIMAELSRHLPGHVATLDPAVAALGSPGEEEALRAAFAALPSTSIDFAVMERAAHVRMVAAPFAWNDLGGWLALEEFLEPDELGNRGSGRLALLDAEGNMVVTEDPDELIALVGVSNLIVVRAGQRTLVVDRSRAEEVKELVRRLEESGHGEHA